MLRNGDTALYEVVVLRTDEIPAIVDALSRGDEARAAKLRDRLQRARTTIFTAAFETLPMAVDWKSATVTKLDYKIGSDGRVEGADVFIDLETSTGARTLVLDDCIRTGRGWVVGDEIRLR